MGKGMNRRQFLTGAGLTGVTLACGALAVGCAPSDGGRGNTDEKLSETGISSESTKAIEPVEVPGSWDHEADIVIVGSGGGGLNAASRAAQLGLSSIVIEKSNIVGGNSRTATMFSVFGGTHLQNEEKIALPDYPYEPKKWVEFMMEGLGQAANPAMLEMMGENFPKCFDWMTETYNIEWTMGNGGMFFTTAPVGMDKIIDAAYDYAQSQGTQFLLETEAVALVVDDGRVVGVRACGTDGNEVHVKGAKAVLLTGGGFAANRDLVAEYCPSALRRSASCYLAPSDSGECFRMGLGVGAGVVNHNCYAMFDGGMDWFEEGQGEWCHYLYDGATQLVRQPWLNIRKDGTRNRYLATWDAGGLTDQATIESSGGEARSYVLFDKNWDTYMQNFKQKACREPIQDGVARQHLIPEYYQDYHAGVQDAIDAGMIKECDTLDELADALGLDRAVLNDAVDKWNKVVESGTDDAIFPYQEDWLWPIDTPPYYGAKIGGNLFQVNTGLAINTDMQVIDDQGKVIPGLYAGWHTAGAGAPDAIISMRYDVGGVSKSYLGGYVAAARIAELEA